jgi:hypothetical protein
MKKQEYRYNLRYVNGYEKEVIACDDETDKGIITFLDEDGGWFYKCSVKNLIDMTVEVYEETVKDPDHTSKPVHNQMPIEHL